MRMKIPKLPEMGTQEVGHRVERKKEKKDKEVDCVRPVKIHPIKKVSSILSRVFSRKKSTNGEIISQHNKRAEVKSRGNNGDQSQVSTMGRPLSRFFGKETHARCSDTYRAKAKGKLFRMKTNGKLSRLKVSGKLLRIKANMRLFRVKATDKNSRKESLHSNSNVPPRILVIGRRLKISRSIRKKTSKPIRAESKQEDEVGEELCKKRILMGGKCKPLNLSGTLQYDMNGVLLPEILT